MEKKNPVLKVEGIHADYEGVFFTAHMPVSYDAFHRIEDGLREEGLDPRLRSGGGSDTQCSFGFGPFTDLEHAKRIIESLRDKLVAVYETEQKYVDEFKALEGVYPLKI